MKTHINTKPYDPSPGESITQTATAMVLLAKQHNCRIRATFNDIGLMCSPDTNPEKVLLYYHTESQRRSDAYWRSPEGIASRKRIDEANAKSAKAEAEGILTFKIKAGMDGEWATCVDLNKDPYGACIVRYAARWANLMEQAMDGGKRLEKIAQKCSHEANKEGITGFMYGCAVSILSRVWEHGEQLRRWHNTKTQLGNEGDKANKTGRGAKSRNAYHWIKP